MSSIWLRRAIILLAKNFISSNVKTAAPLFNVSLGIYQTLSKKSSSIQPRFSVEVIHKMARCSWVPVKVRFAWLPNNVNLVNKMRAGSWCYYKQYADVLQARLVRKTYSEPQTGIESIR